FGDDSRKQTGGLRADRETDTELAGAGADGEGQHASNSNDGDGQCDRGESTEYDGVQAIGRQHLGANVFQRGGMFDRLIDGHIAHNAGDRGDQSVWIHACVDEQAAAENVHTIVSEVIRHLTEGMIDRERGSGNDVFIVYVSRHADDAARTGADTDERHDGIGPHNVAIERVLAREHALCHGLADDDYRLASTAVVVVEVASLNQGDAESGEESWRHGTKLGARVFFFVSFDMAFAG